MRFNFLEMSIELWIFYWNVYSVCQIITFLAFLEFCPYIFMDFRRHREKFKVIWCSFLHLHIDGQH